MNELLDDIARIIASPVSRRQAIRLVSRAVGGAVLTSLGLGRALRAWAAQAVTCPQGSSPCTKGSTSTCCSNDSQKCCNDVGAYCCTASQTCCQGKCCKAGAVCCNGKCCKAGPSASSPCVGANCAQHRLLEAAAIAGGAASTAGVLAATSGAKPACSNSQIRCGSGTPPTCCTSGSQKCCTDVGAYCCGSNQICCGGTCCNQNRICCNGRCCTAGPSSSNPCTGATCS